jgi:hypothetical protein
VKHCDIHDEGGLSPAYLEKVLGVMIRCGWAVQGVRNDDGTAELLYTVGLTARGWPELVMRNVADVRDGQAGLNQMAQRFVEQGRCGHADEVYELRGDHGLPIHTRLLAYPNPEQTLLVVNLIYDEDDRWPGAALELVRV